MRGRLAASLWVLACTFVQAAELPRAIDIQPEAQVIDLAPQTQIYDDPTGKATLAEARLAAYTPHSPVLGFTASAVWLKYRLSNPTGTAQLRWLDTGNRTAQELAVHLVDGSGQTHSQATGSGFRFAERPLPFSNFVFALQAPPGDSELLVRVRTTGYLGTTLQPKLWAPDAYRAHVQAQDASWFIYLGMAAALALLNLMLYAALRDRIYVRYVLSLVSVVWAVSTAEGGYGSAFRLLWPEHPVFEQASWVGSIMVSAYFVVMFMGALTDLPERLPRLWRFVCACLALVVTILGFQFIATLAGWHVPAALMQQLHVAGTIPYSVLMLSLVTGMSILSRRGVRAAHFALAAFIPILLISLVSSVLVTLGQGLSQVPTLWGSGWELIVMALALADRFHQEKRAREEAQSALVDALQRSERDLEAKVDQRTQELQAEKARATELLHNILPAETAQELSATGSARTMRYESVSMLFSDFSGFTQAVSTMPAARLVEELNEIFAAFDDIADECGIEKIKTIGDAYMAAAGLPRPCDDHAQRCVRAGLRMVDYIAQRNRTAAFKWAVRVGVHSGPVIAGVVGKRKYAYDIWGDTVNIASRMESAGEVGRVNISAYSYDLVRQGFRCSYRGKVEAKGKGPIDMYFVEGPLDDEPASARLEPVGAK